MFFNVKTIIIPLPKSRLIEKIIIRFSIATLNFDIRSNTIIEKIRVKDDVIEVNVERFSFSMFFVIQH